MRKRAVVVMRSEVTVSERRACGLIGLYRGTYRYRARCWEDGRLRQRLRELAHQFRRFGYRRLHERLVREGWRVNHKRVSRLYRLEGLQVRKRRRKRCAGVPRLPLPASTAANQVWSLDFMADTLSSGRKLRTLNVVDDYTRKCLAIEVDTSLPGARVVRVLERLVRQRGRPRQIRTDNAPEFAGRALDQWCFAQKVEQHFIQPGKPMQNGYIESFNGKFRELGPNKLSVLFATIINGDGADVHPEALVHVYLSTESFQHLLRDAVFHHEFRQPLFPKRKDCFLRYRRKAI